MVKLCLRLLGRIIDCHGPAPGGPSGPTGHC